MLISKVQLQILRNFITSNNLSYTDAKPKKITNDLYKYHLKFLIEKGYIKKHYHTYELTEKGLKFGHSIDPLGHLYKGFFVCVMNIVIINQNGQQKILLQKRAKHPNFKETSVICGKIEWGEKIVDAAKRNLFIESGLTADFKNIGLIRALRYNKNKKLIQDQWFNVCITNQVTGKLLDKTLFGENYFEDISKIKTIKSGDPVIKNVRKILTIIKENKTPFILEDIVFIKHSH